MLPFFAWKIFSISFFISLDFYLQVLLFVYCRFIPHEIEMYSLVCLWKVAAVVFIIAH